MGMSGAGAAADVVSELEGSLVDLAGAAGEEEEEEAAVVEGDGEKEEQAIMKEADEREPSRVQELGRSATGSWQHAAAAVQDGEMGEPSRVQELGRSATGSWQHAAAAAQDGEMGKATATASKGKKKRLKREAFLARVRARSTSSTVKSGEHLREAATVCQFSSQEMKQALQAWSTPLTTPRHEPPRKKWPSPGDQVIPFQNQTVATEVEEVEGGSFRWAVLASVCRSHSACSSWSRATWHSCVGASPFDSPTSPVLPGEPLLAPLLAQAPHRRSCRMSRRVNPHSPQYPPASAVSLLSLLVPRIRLPSSFQQASKKKTL